VRTRFRQHSRAPGELDRCLLGYHNMLFGRLRVPLERDDSRDLGPRTKSGLHVIPPVRGDSPQRAFSHPPVDRPSHPLSLLPAPLDDEFVGLDRLDREELDED
jgi:hypothetical protein